MYQSPSLALTLIRQAQETQAKTLDLGKCGLTDWPKELFELVHLEELQFSNRIWDQKKREWKESANNGPYNLLSHIPKKKKTNSTT